jgi:hypothetical protein
LYLTAKRILGLVSRVAQYRFSFANAEFCGTSPDGVTADFSRCFSEFPVSTRNQLIALASKNFEFINERSNRIRTFKETRQLSLVGSEMMSPDARPTFAATPGFTTTSLATRYALFGLLGIATQELTTDFYPLGFSSFTGDINGDYVAFYKGLQQKTTIPWWKRLRS